MNSYINILIVDDDKDDAAFLTEGIANIISSFQVHHAANGIECLQYIVDNEPPELIFLDINMPKMNGLDALKSIKKDHYLKGTHVVIFTTSANPEDIDACYRLDAKYYIIKPVSLSAMTNVLEQMFVGLGKPSSYPSTINHFLLKDRRKQL
jgi:CheY-like chemotaxis protein